MGETTVLSGGIKISNGGALGAGAVGSRWSFCGFEWKIVSNSFERARGISGGGALQKHKWNTCPDQLLRIMGPSCHKGCW